MKYLLAPATILTAVAILMSSATPASACLCSQVTTAKRIEETEVIVIGKAVSSTVVLRESDEWPQHIALIDVERYLKGLGPGALPVFFGLGSSCDYNDLYVPGDDFLLFLQRPEAHSPTEHSTYACAGNANLTTGDTLTSIPVDDYLIDVKAATGPGLPPDHSDLPREAFWALAIILPIAFLAAATLAASRRR